MLKQGANGVLFYSKNQNKVRLEFHIAGNAKKKVRLGTAGVFYCSKSKNKVHLGFNLFNWNKAQLGSYIVENAKPGYS